MSKKIMFNDKFCLTQAVLDGTKTMTRRVEKFVTLSSSSDEVSHILHEYVDKRHKFKMINKVGELVGYINPYFEPWEVVAIAQSYKEIYTEKIANFAKHNYHLPREDAAERFRKLHETCAGWRNKMFVKAELMPHHIRITDVKVERLQDISKEDCLKEGIIFIESLSIIGEDAYFFAVKHKVRQMYDNILKFFSSPQRAYADLIDKISGRGTWKRNPWVVAYSFELVD